MQSLEGEIPPPDIWRHERSGALSCHYEGGEQVFTWPPEDVAGMAQRWRDSGHRDEPAKARRFIDTCRRFNELVRTGGLEPPDALIFHLGHAELRAVWEQEKLVVAIDEIPDDAVDLSPF